MNKKERVNRPCYSTTTAYGEGLTTTLFSVLWSSLLLLGCAKENINSSRTPVIQVIGISSHNKHVQKHKCRTRIGGEMIIIQRWSDEYFTVGLAVVNNKAGHSKAYSELRYLTSTSHVHLDTSLNA